MKLIPLQEAVLEISGEEAARYLQGQTTCDVLALAEGEATLGALCDLKGRVEATFWLFKKPSQRGGDRFLMVVPTRMAEPVSERLARYRLRSRVLFEESPLKSFGSLGPPPEGLLGWEVPGVGFRLLADPAKLLPALAERGQFHESPLKSFGGLGPPPEGLLGWEVPGVGFRLHLLPESAWRAREIGRGIPTVLPETRGLFLPQMLGLERLGAVSFQKGCYLGQEVVARAQFRGEVKRRPFLGELAGRARLAPADPLFAEGERVGTVVNAAFSEEAHRTMVLAVVQKEAASKPLETISGQRLSPIGP